MEKDNLESNKDITKASSGSMINRLLLHSYATFLLAVILGVIFDMIFHIDIFSSKLYQYIGLGMIIFGTIAVYWSQSTTSKLKKADEQTKNTNFFLHGPYKYTRNPSNLGLTLMSLGLGLLINSFFSVVFIVITYLVSRLFFIKKQDSILEKRYGNDFLDYKKKVKNWL